MELIYKGKTKDVYKLPDGNVLLQFKDDACGENGVFDPGANQIGGSIDGKGREGLRLSAFFFEKVAELIPALNTHFISCDVAKAQMIVKSATPFGHGLEVICRIKAAGSFVRRYGQYVKDGTALDSLVEFTLKDDQRGDPFITRETLVKLGILTDSEYDTLVSATRNVTTVIAAQLRECGNGVLELIDFKLEFGRAADGAIMIIDEISGDCMRVYDKNGYVDPVRLTKILLGD